MATKKVKNKPEGNQAVGEAVSGVESWLKKNGNLISTIVLVILLAVCAILALNRWVFKPAQQEAKAAAAGADRYFQISQYEQALNGDGNVLGLADVIDQYGKKAGQGVYLQAGICQLQLKNYDEAVKAYEKCAEIQPDYEYGYIGEGLMYYNMALDVQNAAQEELDDNKYMVLVEEFEKDLKGCIDPFEKAFNMTKDESIKESIAEYLKQAYYRFRDADPKYMEAYNKYNAIVEGNK